MRKRSAAVAPKVEPEDEEHDGGEDAVDDSVDTVKKISDELNDSLATPPMVISANPAREVPLNPTLGRIVEKVFVQDIEAAYAGLERDLQPDENSRGDYLRKLERAEDNARLAHRVFLTAKVQVESWERDNMLLFAVMRDKATEDLQREKKQGFRVKQITDADVTAACARLFHDEWRAQELKKARAHAMVKSLENLVEVWMSRCRSLQALVSKQR